MAKDAQGLTPKQRRFVEEYAIDFNATAAYQRAGYKARGNAAEVDASRLLRNAKVQEMLAALRTRQSNRLEVTADRVMLEVARLAYSDPRKLYHADGSLKPIHELSDDEAATIAAVEVFEEYEGTGENRKLVGHLRKIKQWDKNSALDKLCRRLGLYEDTLRVTNTVTVSIEQRRAEFLTILDALRSAPAGGSGETTLAGPSPGAAEGRLEAGNGVPKRPDGAG